MTEVTARVQRGSTAVVVDRQGVDFSAEIGEDAEAHVGPVLAVPLGDVVGGDAVDFGEVSGGVEGRPGAIVVDGQGLNNWGEIEMVESVTTAYR